jgi:Mg2+ and Co2+ transporter CorA
MRRYVRGERQPGGVTFADVAGLVDRDDEFVWFGLRMPTESETESEMAAAQHAFGLHELAVANDYGYFVVIGLLIATCVVLYRKFKSSGWL